MKAKHILVATLYVVVGLSLMVVVWSRAARLLSAPSDMSVLLGVGLLTGAVVFLGLSAYLLWSRYFSSSQDGLSRNEKGTLSGRGMRTSLFPRSGNKGVKESATKKERSYDRRQNQ
jgi:hypothetical protein